LVELQRVAGSQWLAFDAAIGTQVFVELIDHGGREIAGKEIAELGFEVFSIMEPRLRTVVGDHPVRPRANQRSRSSSTVMRAPTAGAILACVANSFNSRSVSARLP
jgi:hypothetical protein